MTTTTPDLNISFEDHLADALTPLRDILPDELAPQLNICLTDPRPRTVSYLFVHTISQWARTSAGMSSLTNNGLSPSNYTMISLLAGTTTSPERKFGSYVPPPDPGVVAAQQSQERKQITTLVNAVLSVGGSAMAALWASQHAGWRYEWRVLFSFFVGIVVAISEAVLYLIWQSRRDDSKKRKSSRISARHKKVDGGDAIAPSPPPEEGNGLRRRVAHS